MVTPVADLADALVQAQGEIKANRWKDAEATLKGALARHPGHAVGERALAIVLSAGRSSAGGAAPAPIPPVERYLPALYDVVNALAAAGEGETALAVARQAVLDMPARAEARFLLATLLQRMGRQADAIEALLPIAETAYAPTLALLGGLLVAGEFTQADGAQYLRRAIDIDPNCATAHYGVGLLAMRQGNMEQARAALRNALAIDPGHADARRLVELLNAPRNSDTAPTGTYADNLRIGRAWQSAQRFDLAERHFRAACDSDSKSAAAWRGLAESLQFQNRVTEATEACERACALDRDDPYASIVLAQLYMSAGRIGEGWDLYEARFRMVRPLTPRPMPTVPRWDGEKLDGRTLLVWREEGIGDELRFSTCLPGLAERLGGRIVFECEPRLAGLYTRTLRGIVVRPEAAPTYDYTGIDCHAPVGSLPKYFRRTIDDFIAAPTPLLKAGAARVGQWRTWLDGLGLGLKVGISWRSQNRAPGKMPFHSSLTDWGPILTLPNITFVNLQWSDYADEIVEAERGFGIRIHVPEGLDLTNDMEGVSALVTALDIVVSTRNTVSNLTGALARPCHMLSAYSREIDSSIDFDAWAPTTKVHFRSWQDSWAGPINAVAGVLAGMSVGRKS